MADFAEDGEFIPQRAPIQGAYRRGPAGMRDFLADNEENFDVFHPYDYEVTALGDRVLAVGKIRVRGKSGGVEIEQPSALVVEYRDGLRATVLVLNGHVDDTTFAARIGGEKKAVATMFYLPPPPGAAFLEALATHVESFLATGKPPYPVDRTLLTGGILDCALDSRVRDHKRLETPDLDISYNAPKDSGFLRGDYAG